jgi:Xaa-Pro aminopeptidase
MDADPAARLRAALELHELGVKLQRQRLRRERPGISEPELDEAMRAWLHERPGAEHGDAIGPASRRSR